MRYPKNSIDYQVNMQALSEMELYVPMTLCERNALRRWAKKGHDLDTNPWNSVDEYGYPLNYLQAYRLEYGYSSGPWDYWRGPDAEYYWDEVNNRFNPKDEF